MTSAETVRGLRIYLWTIEHGDFQEYSFLVARSYSRPLSGQAADEATVPTTQEAGEAAAAGKTYESFGLMRLVMDLHYRVTDPYKFLYGVADAQVVLRALADRELTHYAARRDVDGLISLGREQVSRDLTATLDGAIRRADLGVELVLLAPQGIHPPTEVADAFEEVIKADRERVGKELRARAEAERILSRTAGSRAEANAIAEVYGEARRSQELPPQRAAEVQRRVGELFDRAGGRVKSVINAAQAWRWKRVNEERGEWESFQNKLTAYRAAPNLYKLTEKLRVLARSFRDARKYVLGIDLDDLEIRFGVSPMSTATASSPSEKHSSLSRSVSGGMSIFLPDPFTDVIITSERNRQ